MVPVQDGYVMVKIDFVHENTKDVALPIPLPEADIFTLGMPIPCGSNGRKVVFSSRPLVGRQLVVPKSGHAPPHLILNM